MLKKIKIGKFNHWIVRLSIKLNLELLKISTNRTMEWNNVQK